MAMAKDDWFNTGFGEHIDNAKKEAEKSRTTRRFWMPPSDETREIILLDDEPFCIWEHAIRVNGKWKGHEFTCRKGLGDDPRCPLCMSDANRYYIGFLTILDHTGFKDEKGKWHKNLRRLFPMKTETLDRFKKYKKAKKSLVGYKIEVTRSGKKAPAVGDMFEFGEKVDPFGDERFWYVSVKDGGQKKAPEPFNYREILVPLSYKDMLSIGNGDTGNFAEKGGDDPGRDDDAIY